MVINSRISMILKGTIFEPLLGLYRLKYPSKKYFSKIIITKIETLAISFYTHIFEQRISIPLPDIWPRNRSPSTVRESYQDLFYSIGHFSHSVLDFISCIVCLLGESIFSMKIIRTMPKVSQFLQDLTMKSKKIRQSIFILYTKLSIGLNVSVESAIILFDHYIISENKQLQNLEEQIRVNLQLKQIKEFIERKTDKVDIRERSKRNGRGKNMLNGSGKVNYKEEVSRIMQENYLQIQQEAKINKKYRRYEQNSQTEDIRKGYFSNEGRKRLSRKTAQTKLEGILRLKSKNKSVQQISEQDEESHKYEYWKKIINQMRKSECQKQDQLKLVLLGNSNLNLYFISAPKKEDQVKKRARTKLFSIQSENSFNRSPKKERFKYRYVLPPIAEKENLQVSNKWRQNQSEKNLTHSRKLCKQRKKFILEQKLKAFY